VEPALHPATGLLVEGNNLSHWRLDPPVLALARPARRPRRMAMIRGRSRHAPVQRLVSLTTIVTLSARVLTTLLALSPRECKKRFSARRAFRSQGKFSRGAGCGDGWFGTAGARRRGSVGRRGDGGPYVERSLLRPHGPRTLRCATKIAIFPHNSALGIGAAAQLSARHRGGRTTQRSASGRPHNSALTRRGPARVRSEERRVGEERRARAGARRESGTTERRT